MHLVWSSSLCAAAGEEMAEKAGGSSLESGGCTLVTQESEEHEGFLEIKKVEATSSLG